MIIEVINGMVLVNWRLAELILSFEILSFHSWAEMGRCQSRRRPTSWPQTGKLLIAKNTNVLDTGNFEEQKESAFLQEITTELKVLLGWLTRRL